MKDTSLLHLSQDSADDAQRVDRGESLPAAAADDGRSSVLADRQLVDDCLTRKPGAWERMYNRAHPALMMAVRKHLGSRAGDQQLVEEIAAQVWYLLIQHDGELLDRFSTDRDRRLSSYLGGLAQNQVRTYDRGEQRRHAREAEATRSHRAGETIHESRNPLEMQDFLSTLTDWERQYVAWCMLPPGEKGTARGPFSVTENSDRQLRHRLKTKLKAFFLGHK